ncbi:MAG: DUF2304 domain-containing protein [Usitatibacter sp.]
MKSYHLTVLVLGLGLAVGILHLVRRDHLYIRQGVFWIGIALVSLLFGVWPYLIDSLGEVFGVAYPPTLLLLAAIIVLVVKALLGDMALTQVRRDMRRLNQRIALLESEPPQARTPEPNPSSSAEPAESNRKQ